MEFSGFYHVFIGLFEHGTVLDPSLYINVYQCIAFYTLCSWLSLKDCAGFAYSHPIVCDWEIPSQYKLTMISLSGHGRPASQSVCYLSLVAPNCPFCRGGVKWALRAACHTAL